MVGIAVVKVKGDDIVGDGHACDTGVVCAPSWLRMEEASPNRLDLKLVAEFWVSSA